MTDSQRSTQGYLALWKEAKKARKKAGGPHGGSREAEAGKSNARRKELQLRKTIRDE